MKKLLTILGALSLSVSPSLLVVACSAIETTQYKEFAELANATKPQFNEDGSVKKEGSTLIYYIGAEDNYSSLSFEYAMMHATSTTSLSSAFDYLNNYSGNDKNNPGYAFKTLGDSYTLGNDAGINDVTVKYNKKDELWEYVSKSDNEIFSDEAMGTDIKISGTTIENANDFWTEKTTKQILTKWIKPSIARMTYELTLDTTNDKINENTKEQAKDDVFSKAKTYVDEKTTKISQTKGPIFLIIRNGEFIGYLNGYKVYNNSDVLKSEDMSDYRTKSVVYNSKDLFNFFDIIQKLLPFQDLKKYNIDLLGSIYAKESTQEFNFSSSAFSDFIKTWDNGVSNDPDEASEGETGTGEGETGEGEGETGEGGTGETGTGEGETGTGEGETGTGEIPTTA